MKNCLDRRGSIFYRPKNNEKVQNNAEKLLNLKERRAREILKKLVDKGILEKIGKTKGSYYILKGINNES